MPMRCLREPLDLGTCIVTETATTALTDAEQSCLELLRRHQNGDWGEINDEDWIVNDRAVGRGERIISAYTLSTGVKIWVVTEWDRSTTTLHVPANQ